jgi:Pirin C-terminal cupin domain
VAAASGGFGKREVRIEESYGPSVAPTPLSGDALCTTRLASVLSLSATPEGDIFALGEGCQEGEGFLVERFGAKGASLGLTAIPAGAALVPPAEGERGAFFGVVAVSAREAYVLGQTAAKTIYFAAFDGAKWAPAPPGPFTAAPTSFGARPDGTLWAAADGKAWRKVPGAAWTAVELPDGARVTDVDAPATDMVWAWGPSGEKGSAVYRADAPGRGPPRLGCSQRSSWRTRSSPAGRSRDAGGRSLSDALPARAPSRRRPASVDDDHEERAVYVVEGGVRCDGRTFQPGTMIVLRPRTAVTIETDEPARAMIVGGAKLEGERHLPAGGTLRGERVDVAMAKWFRERSAPLQAFPLRTLHRDARDAGWSGGRDGRRTGAPP